MLLDRGGYLDLCLVSGWRGGKESRGPYLVAVLACANVDLVLFYEVDPACQCAIEQCVESYCDSCVLFGCIPTELVVPVETGCGNSKGSIAKAKTNIAKSVRLLELQGLEVVRNSIVSCVLEIWLLSVAALLGLQTLYSIEAKVGIKFSR